MTINENVIVIVCLNSLKRYLLALGLIMCILIIPLQLQAQQSSKKTIKGQVTNAIGEPVVATVTESGTTNGMITDAEGNFTLQVGSNAVLEVSSMGYEQQKINIDKLKTGFLKIVLEEDVKSLDEMVVIGYGTTKRSEFTGAANVVDMEKMRKTPVKTFAEGLAGRAAGVQVYSEDGQPGAESNIIIRGASSMTQSNQPLYVIDGIPIDDFEQAALNPNDIESMSILKDASSTSIYGARGTNGVIIITTKKGTVGKPTLILNSSIGIHTASKKIEVMSPYEYIKYQLEFAPTSTEGNYLYDGLTLEHYRDVAPVDFQDYLFRSALAQDYSITMRGGTDATKYIASLSATLQDGVIINSGDNRYQGRLSLDQTVNERLKVGLTVNYTDVLSHGAPVALGSTGDGTLSLTNYLFITAWGYRPIAGKDSTDFLVEDIDPLYNTLRVNPIISTENENRKRSRNILLGNMYLNYEIIKDLKLRVQAGIRKSGLRAENFFNRKTTRGRDIPTNINGVNANVVHADNVLLNNDNTLSYRFNINKTHRFDLLLGHSISKATGMRYGFTSTFIPSEELGMSGMDEGIIKDPVAIPTDNVGISYFGRLTYNYKSRYIFSSTLRRDGSSRFSKQNRWGYFPSASLAWNITNEKFMRPLRHYVSRARLRTSYGITGNNRVSDFAYLAGLNMSSFRGSYSFNNGTPNEGMYQVSMQNDALRWESSPQADIGLELGLFKNRIKITLDVYEKLTKGLLMNVDMPANAPVSRVFMNSGEIRNRGWEFELKTVNIRTNNFSWETDFNISHNRNKIIKLANNQNVIYSSVRFNPLFNMPAYVSKVGESMGQFYGFVHDGNYQLTDFEWTDKVTGEPIDPSIINSENIQDYYYMLKDDLPTNGSGVLRSNISPGDIKYKDFDGDLEITSEDRKVLGSPFPLFIGGCSNDFVYKNFDLNVFLQWSYGNKLLNANRLILEGNATNLPSWNQYASYINRWTPENPTNDNFRAKGQGPTAYSSRIIEDGSFLRLKAIAFGYSLPERWIKRVNIQQLRLSLSANNLITWTKYSGLDPEVSTRNTSILTQGFDFSPYPRNKAVTFSLNITY
ncbi:MAG: TonB-dependent receptor [Bacteroidales bacterium]|nr:TonB-dependent receptor [Bacteroidales bacterium]